MKIKTEKEFRAYQEEMEEITAKGTALEDMELLSQEDKEDTLSFPSLSANGKPPTIRFREESQL